MLKHINMRLYPCRCCGLSVTSPEFSTMLRGLDEALEKKGWCLRVNDGTRCPLHNAKVGGHQKSRHMSGQAVDLHPVFPEDVTPQQLKDFINSRMGIKGIYQGGLGLYSWGVHIDIGKTSRWNG